jgi:hydrogenase maturation protease
VSDIVVVGVGNPLRGDDAAGLEVVRRLADLDLDDVEVIESDGEPATLMDRWQEADAAVVVDAVASGAEPGTVLCFDAIAKALPATLFRHSTHLLGIAEAIELARALDKLPPRLTVIGIEGVSWAPEEPMSAAVARAVDAAIEAVLEELEAARA